VAAPRPPSSLSGGLVPQGRSAPERKSVMALRHVASAVVLVAGTFAVTRAVYSQDEEKKGGGMPSDEEMKQMAERATLAPEHAKLAAGVGTWDSVMTWKGEDGKEMTSKGVMTAESLLGGRVILAKLKAEMMGQPFEGVELRGYDKEKKQYWSVWCDSYGTGHMRFTGTEKDGAVALASEPFETGGETYTMRLNVKHVDADHITTEMVHGAAGKPESRSTIEYTRRK
jgi:hypothetical protein